jgi:acetyl esterase/lipase
MLKIIHLFKIIFISLLFTFLAGCASVSGSIYSDIHDAADTNPQAYEYSPSSSYRFMEGMIKAGRYKNIFTGTPESVIRETRKANIFFNLRPPSSFYLRFKMTETSINNRPCFLIEPKKNAREDKAVFFLHGGALMLNISFIHWNVVKRIVSKLSIPVFVPLYPIYPENDRGALMSFVYEAFGQIKREYPQAQITGLGDSAGALLLLSLCHNLSLSDASDFPDRLICVSPAQVSGIDEQTLERMRAIDEYDYFLSVDMLDNLPVLLNFDKNDLSWSTAPFFGDFSRFPPTYVFSGTHDIFYPLIPPFVERVRSQGRYIELFTGIGMMHVWPYMPVAPESRYALDLILDIIERD